MILILSCSCLWPIHWSQVLNREWRCSWSNADRQCSKGIWVINNFIAEGVAYIRGLTVFWYILSCCCAELIFELAFSIIFQNWVGTVTWNRSSWKTRTCLSCIVNTIIANELAMQGARASAAIVWSSYLGMFRFQHNKVEILPESEHRCFLHIQAWNLLKWLPK